MNRRTFDALLATGGLVVAAVLVVAGVLGVWAHSFVDRNVHNQLAKQQIFFPPTAAFATAEPGSEITPDMKPYLLKYAGQQLLTGAQAEAYADHFIAVHLSEMPDGGVYATISSKLLAMKPTDPNYQTLSTEKDTAFTGTTLRGLLLNAYAFWKMGQIALVAAIVSFVGAGIMLLLSALGFLHLRRTPTDRMLFGGAGPPGSHETI